MKDIPIGVSGTATGDTLLLAAWHIRLRAQVWLLQHTRIVHFWHQRSSKHIRITSEVHLDPAT